jgi:glutathione S-transferase
VKNELRCEVANIKLYGYSTSPYVRKVGCCLYYKNLPFEFIPVNPMDPRAIAFTGQTQVPVLQIDDEWRTDSTPLAEWLDELFPVKPLFGQSQQDKEEILALDDWVTNSLILSSFRTVYDAPMSGRLRQTAWRLAAIVSSQTPLADEVRNAWPEILQTAPFIKHMMCHVDISESVKEMRDRIGMELIQHLQGGPFFGGRTEPSLVDFAIFPQLVFGYMVGYDDKLAVAQVPELREWIGRIAQYLPANSILVPDFMLINPLVQDSEAQAARSAQSALAWGGS